ncbi:MAG: hypothetical protein K2H20_00375, partial [Bacilli bacterium]|nr:hypothetical protein [Bacilli bacterium]
FICPLIGLGLCILGIFELFRKNDDGAEEFKTSVIGVVGNTQQLKIVTNDTPVQEYVKTPEEEAEIQVKAIKKEIETVPIIPTVVEKTEKEETPVIPVAPIVPEVATVSEIPVKKKEEPVSTPKVEVKVNTDSADNDLPIEKKSESTVKEAPKATISNGAAAPAALLSGLEEAAKEESKKEEEEKTVVEDEKVEKKEEDSAVEDTIMKKVQENIDSCKKDSTNLAEDDIKKAIKDVLKEVIQEVNEEKEPSKKVEQKRVLPNYYYISGTSLIYEEPGKETKEISLKTIKSVVRTVNKAGSVVKLVVSNDEVKCVLTNMKNIDLEQVANLLHNKMRTIDDAFEEKIEHKEY